MSKLITSGNEILYEQSSILKWSLAIDSIKFIGEYTTEAGPLADDWFFVFANTVDQLHQVPALAIDHTHFWPYLSEKLGGELTP